jgi:hypothetical protein
MADPMEQITYTPSKREGMYVAKDAKGNVCGFVSRESMEADLAYRGQLPDDNLDNGLYQRALDLAGEDV